MKALEGFRLKAKKGGVAFQPRTNIDDTNFCHSLAMNDGENARLLLDKLFPNPNVFPMLNGNLFCCFCRIPPQLTIDKCNVAPF